MSVIIQSKTSMTTVTEQGHFFLHILCFQFPLKTEQRTVAGLPLYTGEMRYVEVKGTVN